MVPKILRGTRMDIYETDKLPILKGLSEVIWNDLFEKSAIIQIALVSIYYNECQNKEEKYIAFLIENHFQK